MNTYPNARDCEHGYQRGHCPYCDLVECERERDNAWDKYAEVCQEKADLERERDEARECVVNQSTAYADAVCENLDLKAELHEARESFADYAEAAGVSLRELRGQLGIELEVQRQLKERLAQAEKERDEAVSLYQRSCSWAEKDLYAHNRELMTRLDQAEKMLEMAWDRYAEVVAENRALLTELSGADSILGDYGACRHHWGQDIAPLTAAKAAGKPLYLPQGTYHLSAPWYRRLWHWLKGQI